MAIEKGRSMVQLRRIDRARALLKSMQNCSVTTTDGKQYTGRLLVYANSTVGIAGEVIHCSRIADLRKETGMRISNDRQKAKNHVGKATSSGTNRSLDTVDMSCSRDEAFLTTSKRN